MVEIAQNIREVLVLQCRCKSASIFRESLLKGACHGLVVSNLSQNGTYFGLFRQMHKNKAQKRWQCCWSSKYPSLHLLQSCWFSLQHFFVLSFGKSYSCSLCLCALLSCTCLRLVLDAAPYIRTVLKFCQDSVISKFLFKIFLFQKRYRKILCCTEMAMAWTTARYKYRSSVVVWPRPTAKPPPCHSLTSTPRRIKGRISRVNMDKVKSS